MRGFDLRQVPVFLDGIPVYVPYDGYVDMGRFTTFDLSEINVAKGFASLLYGANTMGGAINLISRRPVNAFEMDARIGTFSGKGYNWNVNAGSNLGKFYLQVGLSQIEQAYFLLPENFVAVQHENGKGRENSFRDDRKFSIKTGFTPNETDEYVIGYSKQQGEKGTPPYIGNDSNIMTRFWQWPKWDKESLYLISQTALGEHHWLKTRWYYDTFVNELFSYDDATYSSMERPYAFQSFYDDYSIGGNVELESRMFENNTLKLGIQFKNDVHRENDLGEPQQKFVDNTLSLGIENSYQVRPSLTIIPGISYNVRSSTEAQDYNPDEGVLIDFPANTNNAVNAQLGVYWDFHSNHSLQGSVSRKTRFATIKDRYSYRMGRAIPNPDLAAEFSVNYDLTYSGKLLEKLAVYASLYRSGIRDIIQQVDNVQPGLFQLQNSGNAVFYGLETSLNYLITKELNIGGNYSFIQRENKTNPDLLFVHVPDHKVFTYVDYNLKDKLSLLVSTEYNSKRFSTSYGTTAGAYVLANTKASYRFYDNFRIEGGINNLFDKHYSLVEGFPEAGRNFFVNLIFSNL